MCEKIIYHYGIAYKDIFNKIPSPDRSLYNGAQYIKVASMDGEEILHCIRSNIYIESIFYR